MEDKELTSYEQPEQELDQYVEETPIQEEQVEPVQQTPRSNKEENFAALREKVERERREREKIERERDEAYSLLRQIDQRNQEQQRIQQQKEDSSYENFEDDDIIDGRVLRSIHKKQQQELDRMKQEMHQASQQQAAMLVENQIKSKYPDYYNVVTIDNIKKFRDMEPEIAQTLANMPDLFAQANLTYKWIDKLGLSKSSLNNNNDQYRANTNANKPKPASTVSPTKSASGLSNASSFSADLTEDRKKQLYEEMVRLANSR